MSSRITAVLLILLVICSLALVKSRYLSRRLYYGLEQAQAKAHQLDLSWSQLMLDRSIYSNTERIQEVATKDLGMVAINHSRMQYISVGGK